MYYICLFLCSFIYFPFCLLFFHLVSCCYVFSLLVIFIFVFKIYFCCLTSFLYLLFFLSPFPSFIRFRLTSCFISSFSFYCCYLFFSCSPYFFIIFFSVFFSYYSLLLCFTHSFSSFLFVLR